MPDRTRQQSPADEIRASLSAKVTTIKSRRDLSDEGRARQLAKATVAARTEMAKLRRKDTERTEQRRAELRQRLFGNPKNWDSTTVISFRDAADRADKLKDAPEAATLLERAITSGDDILGRAIAQHAMSRIVGKGIGSAWAQIVDRWVENQPPDTAEDIQELADIEHGTTDVKARFAAGMSYHVPTPPQIAGKNIDGLAAAADRPSE